MGLRSQLVPELKMLLDVYKSQNAAEFEALVEQWSLSQPYKKPIYVAKPTYGSRPYTYGSSSPSTYKKPILANCPGFSGIVLHIPQLSRSPGVTVICVPQWCVFPEHITLGMRVSPNVYPWDRCFPERVSLRLAQFNIISDICFPVISVSSRRLS